MKHFITFLALTVLLVFTSCTIENDSYDVINEQENSITINSYKTATITYDSNIDVKVFDELKVELKVQKTFIQANNKLIWVMYNNEETSYLEEFVMFSDGILTIEIVDGKISQNDLMTLREGGEASDEEKMGDTTGDEDATTDEEKMGDTTGDEDATTDEEKIGDTTGDEDATTDEEKRGDTTGDEDATTDEE